MRIVEVSGSQAGTQHQAGDGQFQSMLLGPDTEPEHHQFAAQLRGTLAAHQARKQAHQQDERSGGPPGAEALSTARRTGAKHAVDDLSGRLADNWVLIRGYRNARGPIGQVLVGPGGLVAMTSLFLDAVLHCRGDKWHAEPSAHQHPRPPHLDDREGRSPSVALNQSADELEHALHAAGVQTKIHRVILLNHPAAQRGEFSGHTVRVFTSGGDLVGWLHTLPKTLDRGVKRQIEELITGGPRPAG